MKTLTKMFSVWCWCLCMCTFAFSEKQAVSQEDVLRPALEPMTQEITPEQKLQIEENKIASQKAADLQLIEEKRQAALNAKLQNKEDNESESILSSFEKELRITTNDSNEISENILKAMIEKGFNSVEEYLDYLAANEAALTKEDAVSYETYLQGLDAKEQAVILEYILQSPSNEGAIRNNSQLPHFKGFSPDRNPMNQ